MKISQDYVLKITKKLLKLGLIKVLLDESNRIREE